MFNDCTLCFRYTHPDPYGSNESVPDYLESTNLMSLKENVTFNTVVKQIFCPTKKPTNLSSSIVAVEVFIFGEYNKV